MCEVSDPTPTAIFGIFPTCFAILLGIVGVLWGFLGWGRLMEAGVDFGVGVCVDFYCVGDTGCGRGDMRGGVPLYIMYR